MDQNPQVTRKIFGSDTTMGLFVALYLILLAFFIILTAVSSQSEQRANEAMDSVNETFLKRNKISSGQSYEALASAAADDPVLRSIQSRFSSSFNVSGSFEYSNGYVYQVTLPIEYLFEPGSFKVRQQAHSTLTDVLAILSDSGLSAPQNLSLLFGIGTRPPEREMTRRQEIAVRRSNAFASFAEPYSGLDFSAGFASFPENEILLVFRRVSRGAVASRMFARTLS